VFEDELLLIIGFEYQRVLIETLDATGEFHSTHQVYGENDFVFPGVV
jgi:hypothetical protein